MLGVADICRCHHEILELTVFQAIVAYRTTLMFEGTLPLSLLFMMLLNTNLHRCLRSFHLLSRPFCSKGMLLDLCSKRDQRLGVDPVLERWDHHQGTHFLSIFQTTDPRIGFTRLLIPPYYFDLLRLKIKLYN